VNIEDDPTSVSAITTALDRLNITERGVRQWIKRADVGDPAFAWLKFCVIRIERSVFIDDVRFRDSLYQRTAIPAAPSRRTSKPATKAAVAAQ